MTILGAIIAGGRSSRFGSDKATARLGAKTLIDHVLAGLGGQVDALVICGRTVPGVRCIDDWPEAGLGPLGGLAAALRLALDEGFSAVLTSACDTPVVPANLVHRLAGPGPSIISGQPLFGYWPAHLAPALDAFLQQQDRRAMRDWASSVSAREVAYSRDILNINTTTDLLAARIEGIMA